MASQSTLLLYIGRFFKSPETQQSVPKVDLTAAQSFSSTVLFQHEVLERCLVLPRLYDGPCAQNLYAAGIAFNASD